MGHYYSEMVSDSELEKRAAEKKKRRAASVEKLRAAIDERGIADVLSEWLEDDTLFRIHYRP